MRGHPTRGAGLAGLIAAVVVSSLGAPGGVRARVLIEQQEALRLVFPEARIERRTAYLDEKQLAEVNRLAGPAAAQRSAMVPHYVAFRAEMPVGVAYFDTHVVRTEAETVMIVVTLQGRVARTEVISFDEPDDYLARPAWLDQFDDQELDEDLELKRDIQPMTGATLTARAITAAVRRALALHAVIRPLAGSEASGEMSP